MCSTTSPKCKNDFIRLQAKDLDALDRTAGSIRGRSGRICNVVASEMDNYEPGIYTERVMEAIRLLSDRVMPNFALKVEAAVGAFGDNPSASAAPVDENEFIDATR